MKAAGTKTNPFTPEAVSAIFQHSRGIPRIVQNVALAAMLVALPLAKKSVDETCVQQAIVDMEDL
jgi:type II secretory pathway predicted ATPase ExeA